jgi:hypothetical protein
VGAGAAILVASLILTQLSATTPVAMWSLAFALYGIGFGLVAPPITAAAVSGMPPAQAGVAAAIASTCRLTGITLGVAIAGGVVAHAVRHASATDLAKATHPAWWVIATLGLAVIALGTVTTTRWARLTIGNVSGIIDLVAR